MTYEVMDDVKFTQIVEIIFEWKDKEKHAPDIKTRKRYSKLLHELNKVLQRSKQDLIYESYSLLSAVYNHYKITIHFLKPEWVKLRGQTHLKEKLIREKLRNPEGLIIDNKEDLRSINSAAIRMLAYDWGNVSTKTITRYLRMYKKLTKEYSKA